MALERDLRRCFALVSVGCAFGMASFLWNSYFLNLRKNRQNSIIILNKLQREEE